MQMRTTLIGLLSVVAIALAINLYISSPNNDSPLHSTANTFEDCVAEMNQVMESHPRQCRTADGRLFVEELTVEDEVIETALEPQLNHAVAKQLAESSVVCGEVGPIGAFETYNQNSGTWWFQLEASKSGCSPACVVDDASKETEVNWRCTGLNQ